MRRGGRTLLATFAVICAVICAACGDDDGGGADGGGSVSEGCPATGRPADGTPCRPVGQSCYYDPDTRTLLPDPDPCALRTDCVSSEPAAEVGEFAHWDGVACVDAGSDGG